MIVSIFVDSEAVSILHLGFQATWTCIGTHIGINALSSSPRSV